MWRVDIYDKAGNIICWRIVESQRKAERVALGVTRNASVTTKTSRIAT
jgi:hypothetical protein